ARDNAVGSRGRQLSGGMSSAVPRVGLSMKRARLRWQHGGEKIREIRRVPAAIGQCELTAEQQQAAAASIHEIANQCLLRGSEIAGLHRSDNQSLVCEKILRAGREAV